MIEVAAGEQFARSANGRACGGHGGRASWRAEQPAEDGADALAVLGAQVAVLANQR